MTDEQQGKPENFYGNPIHILEWLRFAIVATAEPYRFLFYRFGSRGISATGIASAAGLFIAYPLLVQAAGPPASYAQTRLFMLAWWGMAAGAAVHQFGAVLRFRCNHRREIGRFWLGDRAEPVAVALTAIALHGHFPGMATWLAVAYACSTIEIWLIRARYAVQAGKVRDGQAEAEKIRDRVF